MNVKFTKQEVEFLKNILDQWEHDDESDLADTVYAKLVNESVDHPGQMKMEIVDNELVLR